MDSGNSGSIQSSSGGGDEDYDSRTESISSFLNPSFYFPQISLNQTAQPPPQPQLPLSLHPTQQQQQQPTTFFNTLTHNLNSFSSNPNSLYNLDPLWNQQRSDLNFNNDVVNRPVLLPSSSNQSILGPQRSDLIAAGPSSNNNQATNTVKTSRKRTRASRRAPTTVLTTDTLNFRQMVQEFTGIPSPPFSATAASSYPRRFDILSNALRSSSGGPMETLSPLFNHPFRPSPQKLHHPSTATPPFMSKTPLNSNPPNNFPLQALLQHPNSLNHIQDELGFPHNHISGNLAAFPGLITEGVLTPADDQGPHLQSYGGAARYNNNNANVSDFNSEKQVETHGGS